MSRLFKKCQICQNLIAKNVQRIVLYVIRAYVINIFLQKIKTTLLNAKFVKTQYVMNAQ